MSDCDVTKMERKNQKTDDKRHKEIMELLKTTIKKVSQKHL